MHGYKCLPAQLRHVDSGMFHTKFYFPGTILQIPNQRRILHGNVETNFVCFAQRRLKTHSIVAKTAARLAIQVSENPSHNLRATACALSPRIK